jgi:hypothetical protein
MGRLQGVLPLVVSGGSEYAAFRIGICFPYFVRGSQEGIQSRSVQFEGVIETLYAAPPARPG